MRRYLHLLFASLYFGALTGSNAEDIILRIAPSDDAKIVGSVTADDSLALNAAPVLDQESAAEGWQWAEYLTTTVGYIPENQIGKNFAIASETFIRAAPEPNAAILSTTTADDRIEYLRSDGNWATVRFTKAIPVYFQSAVANAPATASKEGGITVTYGSEPTEVSEPTILEIEQPTIESAPPAPIMVAEVEQPVATTPRRPSPAEGIPTRILSGKLIRENTNFGPRYPIRILGKSGKQLAYVDMSNIFISDLRPYINQQVFIRGEVRPLVPGGEDLVIKARTIQIAP